MGGGRKRLTSGSTGTCQPPQTRVGEVELTECPPSLEPRFNLLIFLINHSPSSYPLRGPEDPVSPQLRFQRLRWEKSPPVAPQ